jgi:hypothetical protein
VTYIVYIINSVAEVGKSGLLDSALAAWNNFILADSNKREIMEWRF